MESKQKDVLFRKIQIYFFSGTGNARQVAGWMKRFGDEFGLASEVLDITRISGEVKKSPEEGVLLGFCCPTHGFNFPPIMLRFLFRFPAGTGKVFIVNTRAGMKIGRFHMCGLSGVAQVFSAIILRLKGYRIVGMMPIDLPSNWISIHPGIRQKVVNSIFQNCERRVRKFTIRLLMGGKSYRALLDIIQDILVSPIALAYYFVGRFILAKSFVASHNCDMCGLCVKSCPVQAIKVVNNRPFWTLKCESCMRCMNACPKRAIETAHGFVVGMMYIIFTFGLEGLYLIFVAQLPDGGLRTFLYSGAIRFFIASALAIPFLICSYRLIHLLMRFRFFERFVVYSSLTFYRFWRRYKGRNG